jgi:hypothetical protein
MTAMLSNPEREKLAKLLGLLGSAHQGERDAAGLAAHRLVKASGVKWCDVVCIPQTAPAGRSQHATDPFGGGDWRSIAVACGRYPYLLNKWEHEFLSGLPRVPRLSAKQSATFTGIVTRLRTAGCAI